MAETLKKKFVITRFDPDKDEVPKTQEYEIPVRSERFPCLWTPNPASSRGCRVLACACRPRRIGGADHRFGCCAAPGDRWPPSVDCAC